MANHKNQKSPEESPRASREALEVDESRPKIDLKRARRITTGIGFVLVAIGLIAYFTPEATVAASAPAFLGASLVICAALAKTKRMQVEAILAAYLIGFLGGIVTFSYGALNIMVVFHSDREKTHVISLFAGGAICLAFSVHGWMAATRETRRRQRLSMSYADRFARDRRDGGGM